MKKFARKTKTSVVSSYAVVLRPEKEGGYTAVVPSLLGCITYGKNVDEAREMAKEAISLYIETLNRKKEPVPTDSGSLISLVTV